MPDYRPVNPQINGNAANPTGTSALIGKSQNDINLRYRKIKAGILKRIETLELSPTQTKKLLDDLEIIIKQWLLEGTPKQFWFTDYTLEAATQGATAAQANLAHLSPVYAGAARSVERIVNSDVFLNRVALTSISDYSAYSDLSAKLQNQLSTIVTDAVANGKNPKVIAPLIEKELSVSAGMSRTYAQTAIPGAYRESQWAENDWAREELGIKTALLWASARKATTRASHGARHGKVYTTEQVREFYASGSERWNCYCSQTSCLVDDDGKLIATEGLKTRMKEQREAWQKDKSA